MQYDFITSLENKSLKMLSTCSKSDLHNHAGRGGNINFIAESAQVSVPKLPAKFDSLAAMQKWYSENVKSLFPGAEGQLKRWEAAFRQAQNDNITVLAMSFGTDEIELFGGMETFVKILTEYNRKYANNTLFLPELSYLRGCDVHTELFKMDEILSYNFFKSIDICADEFIQPAKEFKPIFRKAKEYGLRLKAHVGEYGTADDVMRTAEELELDEVHHGIAAADSSFVMNWLSENKIQLNICPTSNVMLGRAKSYEQHPIKILYNAGIPVTVNTDDMLIFNQSVSQEYLNLFNCGLMTAQELDEIRITGLNQRKIICQ